MSVKDRGIPPRLAYLLRDPNSGAVVVPELYHRHASAWTVNAPATGYPGTSTMGGFDLSLPAPADRVFGRHRDQYDAILAAANSGVGLRVEGYQERAGAGAPVVSGVLTKMDLPLDQPWRLTGMDSLLWLQQSQLFPGEQIALGQRAGGATSGVIAAFSGTKEVLWDDDFSNWSGTSSAGHPASTDYTQTGGTWVAAADPQWGLSSLKGTTAAAVVTTNTTWSDSQYAACSITAHGVVQAGTDTTFAGNVGILLASDATGANGYLIELVMSQTSGGSGLYNVSVRINSVAAGIITLLASASNVFTNVSATFPFEFAALRTAAATGSGLTTTTPTLRALLNGKDAGLNVAIAAGSGGRVGLRFGFSGGGSPAMYVNALKYRSRTNQYGGWFGGGWGTNRFQAFTGVILHPSTSASVLVGQGQTHLDVILAEALFEGGQLRKDCGAGAKGDQLTYVHGTGGTDLSASVVFEEDRNIVASGTKVTNVAELYASDVRTNSIPGSDTGGSVTWGRIGAPGDMVVEDTVSDVGMVGFSMLVQYARLIQARKVAPLQAVQVEVVRDADLLRFNNGWGPRELDTVTVHMPTFGIRYQKAQIVGYQPDETKGTVTYFITQFPEAQLARHALQRIARSLDYLTTTYAAR